MDRRKQGKAIDPEASKLLSSLIANDPFAVVDKENQNVGPFDADSRQIVEGVDPLRFLHVGGDRGRLHLELDCNHVRRCAPLVGPSELLRKHLRSQTVRKR